MYISCSGGYGTLSNHTVLLKKKKLPLQSLVFVASVILRHVKVKEKLSLCTPRKREGMEVCIHSFLNAELEVNGQLQVQTTLTLRNGSPIPKE